MNPSREPDSPPPLPPEEMARRKVQIWLVTVLMVLGLCLIAAILLAVFWLFGEKIRLFLGSLGIL